MARRFGGKYSPGGSESGADPVREQVIDQRRVDAAGARANILFLPAIVLVFFSLGAGPTTLLLALAGGGILTLAAWLVRDGLRAEAAYTARKVARRPAIPRKMLASAATGIGIFLAGMTGDAGIVGSALYGIAAVALHVAAFGIDPLKNKRMEGIDEFQQDRVARVVDEAEAHLTTIESQIALLNDRGLSARVGAFTASARKMIRTVEEDPRDLTGARKYLGVYLMGARDATIKFVDLYKRKQTPAVRTDYELLLTDLEQNFTARTEKMLIDDRTNMDIEIKVLRDRLQREGVHLNTGDENV
ncbi:MAG: 5-bromo-4-chloroindolyl phosphate hydrolysis family protein [Paracoccaceae bacterium]